MDAIAPLVPRSFALRDCLVIVAAAALASWLLRESETVNAALWAGRSALGRRLLQLYLLMFAGSTAMFVLALLPPRPRLRVLGRCPGFSASLAVAAYGLIAAAQMAAKLVHWPASQANSYPVWVNNTLMYIAYPGFLGPAVVLTWTVVGVSGLRTRGANWVEWAGRLLGGAWVAIWLVLIILQDLLGISL